MKIDLKKLSADSSLPPNDSLLIAMNNDRIESTVIHAHIFDFPFISVNYPIHNDEGHVIGCVGIARSLEKENKIEEISQNLASTMQQISASVQQVAAGSQGLSGTLGNVIHSANESAEKIKKVNQVITAITDISTHSNLLGLNASIEAARAGEQGRGFSVVAEEMRKLAAQSKESAQMVTQILLEMKDTIQEIISGINNVGGIAENQAAATQEITAALTEVSNTSVELMNFTKI